MFLYPPTTPQFSSTPPLRRMRGRSSHFQESSSIRGKYTRVFQYQVIVLDGACHKVLLRGKVRLASVKSDDAIRTTEMVPCMALRLKRGISKLATLE
jgi:hypothetical protein